MLLGALFLNVLPAFGTYGTGITVIAGQGGMFELFSLAPLSSDVALKEDLCASV